MFGQSEGLFTEYRSPLVGSSLRVSAAPQTLLASDELVQQARSALHSFVVRKRRIDITRQWCRFESDGGICVDNSCPRLHASQITPEGL